MSGIFIHVDPESPEPLYRQLERSLREAILSGSIRPGERLLSSRELADLLNVSRNTVKVCYQELLATGLVVAKERRGIFVNRDVVVPPGASAADPPGPRDPGAPGWVDWDARIPRAPDARMPEIHKPADWADAPYPFLAGQVEPGRFPARAWLRCLREALYKPHLARSVEDDLVGDDPLLVEMIQTRILPSRGVYVEPGEILITVGSQHGLSMLARTLVRPGAAVLMEDPGYLDARHIFARNHARIHLMPTDDQGAVIPASLDGIDLVSVTPSHHQPTNVTLSLTRRRQLLDRAAASGTVLVEDDYDSELRYRGRPSPSLRALGGRDVLYLGTFSKFLCPGLRLGYLVAPPAVIAALRAERRYTVRHAPGHVQRAMGLFVQSGDYHRALRLKREQMRLKWLAMTQAIDRHFPFPCPEFPPGGVSLWVPAPEGLDVRALIRAAATRGVLLESGDLFYADPGPHPVLRIGYGAVPLRSIEPGIAILGRLIAEQLGGPDQT